VSPRQAIGLVARREVLERTRERSFAIGTAVTILILAAIVLLPAVFGGGDEDVTVAAAGDRGAALVQAAAKADDPFDVAVHLRRTDSDAEARRLLRDREVDVAVLGDGRTILRRGGPPDGAVAVPGH
jgi:ABC-2 type transport system permease protein